MSDANPLEIKLTTSSDRYSVAPGGSLEIPVVLANQSAASEQVRISVDGIPLVWVSAEQQVLLLQPGEERQVILTIRPPALPNARIGRYSLKLLAASAVDPERLARTQVFLTVAGFEVKGRVGVLLDGLRYSVIPGEPLRIPVVLINQGLGSDVFRLAQEELPEDWVTVPGEPVRLEPGEVVEAALIVHPPRHPNSRASRYPFHILVASQEAPDQSARIDCVLTVAAFIEFNSALQPPQPDQNLPAQAMVLNLSNVPATFRVAWSSPEDSLVFEPAEPQQVNVPSGETAKLEYTARPSQRVWVGDQKQYPYTVKVKSSDEQIQTLEGAWTARGMLPVWAALVGAGALLLLCLCLFWSLLPGRLGEQAATGTPLLTATAPEPLPTATQSQIDQKALLVERNWFLVAFNSTSSLPGAQEAFTRFNPDGTLIGYTGCKNLSSGYQTDFNQISISNLNLSPGVCSTPALQQQEDVMLAILRSARSYFVADTALQIAGDSGFLNYSLSPVNRPEEAVPPQAAIRAVPQSEAGQVVVFDGAASTGQIPLVNWNWDFGDGVTASGPVVQHVYPNPGTFTVRLTVTDQRSQTAVATHQIHILAKPTTAPTAAPPTLPPPTLAPPTVAPPTVAPPTIAPELPTAPPVPTLEPPTATPEPPPQLEPPQARADGPRNGYIGEPVIFDASGSRPGSSPIASYNWVFGNGEVSPVSPDPTGTVIYLRPGDFEVTVFVVDANGLSSYASTRILIGARLESSVWSLASINGQLLLPGTAVTLQFLNGELAGFAGCNTYNGRYTAADNGDGSFGLQVDRLSTGRLNLGRLACPDAMMTQENSFLAALEQATSAVVQENRITLETPSGALVFYLVYPR